MPELVLRCAGALDPTLGEIDNHLLNTAALCVLVCT